MNYDLWIGIDVSKDTLDICVLTQNKTESKKINNQISEIKRFFNKEMYKNAHIVMEATGVYHNKLVIILTELKNNFSVVNPLIIKKYAEMKMLRAKTDSVDAKLIAQYAENQKPELFRFKQTSQIEIMELVRAVNGYKEEKTTYINRIKALDNKYVYSKKLYNSYKTTIKQIEKHIKILNAEINKIIKDNYSNTADKIRKIPGAGEVLTSTIIGLFGNFENFDSAKQVVSFVGLNPHPKESGSSVYRGSNISKKGCPYIRKVLFMAALPAKEYNQSCHELYYRLKNKGKSEYQARIAVAHKLLRQIFAVVKFGREFEQNYVKIA